jgi:hypothetical protein
LGEKSAQIISKAEKRLEQGTSFIAPELMTATKYAITIISTTKNIGFFLGGAWMNLQRSLNARKRPGYNFAYWDNGSTNTTCWDHNLVLSEFK